MKENQSDFIDIGKIFREYLSKWYWFVISIVCCCVLGFFASKLIRPKYEVRANIRLTENASAGNLLASKASSLGGVGDLFGGNANGDDEVSIVTSHSVLRDVATALDLNRKHFMRPFPMVAVFKYSGYPIDVVPDPSINLDTLRTGLAFGIKVNSKGLANIKIKARGKNIANIKNVELPYRVETKYGDFTVQPTPYYIKGKKVKTQVTVSGNDDAAESLRASINVALESKRSSIISMQMITDDPDYACEVLNTLIEKYNIRGLEEYLSQTSATAQFINTRLNRMRHDLDSIEGAIAVYQESASTVSPFTEAPEMYRQMLEVENELIKQRVSTSLAQVTLQIVRQSAKDDSLIPLFEDSNAAGNLIQEYNNAVLSRNNLERSAKPDNPTLKALNEQIETIRANLITTLNAAIKRSQELETEYNGVLKGLEGNMSDVPKELLSFRSMSRERQIQEELYIFMLKKQEETSILMSNISPKGTVVDAAYSLNEDKSISKKMILLLAFFFGLMIPPVLLYIRKITRQKFDKREEVEEFLSAPVLGEICTDQSGKQLVVTPGGSSSTSELFRLIRANLQFIMRDPGDKVVLFTSTSSGEGKSFVSINMAASMCMLGKRTLLVGMDIRKPRLAEYLGIKSTKPGLTEYLASPGMNLDDIIIRDAVLPGFDVILAGPVPPNPSEMLASESVDVLFHTLRERYDYILIDSAPVGMVSDSFLLSRISDATIYVVRANYTRISDLKFINELYANKRLNRISVVVNGTTSQRGYGYGYGEKK